VWPGDPAFRLEFTRRMADGQPCNLSRLSLGSHAGTHVDAPYHFVADGTTVDELPLEILIGKARVVSVPVRDAIGREHLEALDLRDDIRLLIKTRNSGSLRQPAFRARTIPPTTRCWKPASSWWRAWTSPRSSRANTT